MVDVSNVSLQTSLLGEPISFPVCIAPTGIQMLANPLGETATAKGMYCNLIAKTKFQNPEVSFKILH